MWTSFNAKLLSKITKVCWSRLDRTALSLDKKIAEKSFRSLRKREKQPFLARDHGAHAQNCLPAQCKRKILYWNEADLNRMWIRSYPTLYLSDSHPLSVNRALCTLIIFSPTPIQTIVRFDLFCSHPTQQWRRKNSWQSRQDWSMHKFLIGKSCCLFLIKLFPFSHRQDAGQEASIEKISRWQPDIARNRRQNPYILIWLGPGRRTGRRRGSVTCTETSLIQSQWRFRSDCLLPSEIGTSWCGRILHSMAFVLFCLYLSKKKKKEKKKRVKYRPLWQLNFFQVITNL